MSKLENERAILNKLIIKYPSKDNKPHPKVLKQSQKVDKLIVEETKKINNIKWGDW